MVPETVSHYRVIRRLGGGGMGVVYEAVDQSLGRHVAIKFISAEITSHPHAVARLRREARAASALNHPNICTVYEFGEHEGQPFIVFERLVGATLAETQAGRPLPLETILEFGAGIAAALDSAHHLGVIHRDIKPGNLFVTSNHVIKVLDFGLAKPDASGTMRAATAESETTGASTVEPITEEGTAVGTAAYMSPEQALGREVDHRTDIFSLGAVLYEMATGKRAFDGSSHVAVHDAVLHRSPPPASRGNPVIPGALDDIIAKALEKDREWRYQSAAEVRVDLQRLLRGIRSGPTTPVAMDAANPATTLRFRRYLAATLVAALLVLAGGVSAWLYFFRRPGPVTDPFTLADKRLLTTSSTSWETEPALSPDGNLVAYTSNASGNPDVWFMNAAGGESTNLTENPASDHSPVWMPDASAILFTSDRGGTPSIWRAPFPKGAATLLIPNAVDVAVSKDGEWFAFARVDERSVSYRIYVGRRGDLGAATRLTGDGDGMWSHRQPSWSPDGQTVAYRAQNSLWIKGLTAEHGTPLRDDGFRYHSPAWSRDGNWIYFSSDRGGIFALWRIRKQGGQPEKVLTDVRFPSLSSDNTRLAYATPIDEGNLVLRDVTTGNEQVWAQRSGESMPVWSADGQLVFFLSDRGTGRDQVWMTSSADRQWSGPSKPITDLPEAVSHPSPSPDARHVAFYRIFPDRRELWVAGVATGQSSPLTAGHSDIHPAWSPLGTQIAFAREEQPARFHIWLVPVKPDGGRNGEPTQLTKGSATESGPGWSRDGKRVAYVSEPRDVEGDVYVVDADGRSEPKRVTTGAGALRVRWIDNRAVMVFGRWGSTSFSVRAVDVSTRAVKAVGAALGANADLPDFDVTPDGRWLVFARDDPQSNICLVDTRSRRR